MFVLSKLLSALEQPLAWFMVLAVLSWVFHFRKPALARRMLWLCVLGIGVSGWQVFPDVLLRPLENTYPIPQEPLTGFAGVIVLGGATDNTEIFTRRQQVPLGDAAERMTVPVELLRRHPDWRLVFSGGEGRLLKTGIPEAELAQRFFIDQGVSPHRVLLESASRNTQENALQTEVLLGKDCQRPWLLVTSAWHMPRSMLAFKETACHVVPYPVDFRTWESTPWAEYSLVRSALRWQVALHEWIGIGVHHLTH